MSKFLLSENILYKTKLTKEQAINKLADNIEEDKSTFLAIYNDYSKPYIGVVNKYKFEIEKVITYRNSFLPIITGEVFSNAEGTEIKVNMQLHSFVLVFMMIWLGGASFACLTSLYLMFNGEFSLGIFVPFGMLLFGILLSFGGFRTESKNGIEDLKQIFEADEVIDLDEVKGKV